MKPKSKPKHRKWEIAVGTTSRVPGFPELHYLILDFDSEYYERPKTITGIFPQVESVRWQRTPNGWHCYTDFIAPFKQICEMAAKLGADPQWLKIGRERGYLFLADKKPMPLPWPVERMVIWWS